MAGEEEWQPSLLALSVMADMVRAALVLVDACSLTRAHAHAQTCVRVCARARTRTRTRIHTCTHARTHARRHTQNTKHTTHKTTKQRAQVTTLSLVALACVEDGPLAAALLPRTPSLELGAAANLLDLLLASLLRGAATFLFVGCGGAACAACAPGAGLAAVCVAHAAAAGWLAAKAALGARLAGGDVAGGRLEVGGATLRVAALLATEVVGIAFSG
jgi:hypothetical protein